MANYDTWGQSSRGLLNDFSLQAYGAETVPLSTRAHSHVPSEVEFSEIDLGNEAPVQQNAKVSQISSVGQARALQSASVCTL